MSEKIDFHHQITIYRNRGQMSNLGKKWSATMCRLVGYAIDCAHDSLMRLKHGAILFSAKKQIHYSCCNREGNKICGFDVPSIHAEACCINAMLRGRFETKFQRRGIDRKSIGKYNVMVIRISSCGELRDSEPCCMCVNMMKLYGIKKVYYSNANGELCCRKISHYRAALSSESAMHISHGLRLMTQRCVRGRMANKKLPLTKEQKTCLMRPALH